MNKYGRLAMSHWQKTDPDRYRQIPRHGGVLRGSWGRGRRSRSSSSRTRLAGPDRPARRYLEKVGRLNMARLAAEEQVLSGAGADPRAAEHREEDQDGDRPGRPGSSCAICADAARDATRTNRRR